ncbi:5722_t:CDS:2, partial [Racocetra fulgida]
PEPFWTLSVSVAKQGTNGLQCGPEINLSWERARVFDKNVATTYQAMVRECKEANFIMTSDLDLAIVANLYAYRRTMSDKTMPELHQDEILKVTNVKLVEGKTSPPDYLTESEVISLKHGIGTDASIPVHIDNICQRNYVTVQGAARRLVPTNLGNKLSFATVCALADKRITNSFFCFKELF